VQRDGNAVVSVEMKRLFPLLLLAACVAAGRPAAAQTHRDYTAADVHFMAGMIVHHAQAVVIAGWAPTHDAGPALRTLCERIVSGQTDDIALLSRWLDARHETHTMMPGMDSAMLMPGMLTAAQLARLDRARGPEFDRLFLRFMIQHHQGAITMVNQLFASQGGEEETVYRMAANVFADQTTEIERMQRMLAATLFETPTSNPR
jgi:uncharacterized protein (DUF305 family)